MSKTQNPMHPGKAASERTNVGVVKGEYDDLTRLASRICGTPAAYILRFADAGNAVLSAIGMDANEIPADSSFASLVTANPTGILEVKDIRKDPRFRTIQPATGIPGMVFYAGTALTSPEGEILGTLSVCGPEPGKLNAEQAEGLQTLARQAERLLELSKLKADLESNRTNLNLESQRLRNILDATRVGTWEWYVQEERVVINDYWAEIIGYSLKELEPVNINTWYRFLHPEDALVSEQAITECFERKRDFYNVEYRLLHKEGHWVWINDRGRVISWSKDGKPLIMVGTHTDVTERKKAEAVLSNTLSSLSQRVKEQACLGRIVALGNENLSDNELLKEAVAILPSGWQYPGVTAASVRYGSKSFKTKGYRPTQWTLTTDRTSSDGRKLSITVASRQKVEEDGKSPFLKEEKRLLESIADNLLVNLNKIIASNYNQLILKTTDEGICGMDHRGVCTFINPAAARLLGYHPDECLGQNLHALMHYKKEDGSPLTEEECSILRAVREMKVLREEEDVFWHKDGSPVPVRFSSTPLVEDGKSKGSVLVFGDISERKAAERKLLLSERRFRSLVEHGSDAIAIIRPDGGVSYASPSVKHILGYSEKEALSLNLLEIIHPQDLPGIVLKMEEVMSHPGQPIRGQTSRTRHKNGSWVWLEATITNMIHDPNINGIVDNFRDVTETTRLQQMDRLEHRLMEQSISAGFDLKKSLTEYLLGLERVFGDMTTSIMRHFHGRLHNLASPSLPADYLAAIEGLEAGAKAGSCGTAAYTGKRIIVPDIRKDTRWEPYREFALKHNLLACWSQPIFDSRRRVIATFAIYYETARKPSAGELDLFNRAASLLSLVLENEAKSKELLSAKELYDYVNLATSDAIYDFNVASDHLRWGQSFERMFGHRIPEHQQYPLTQWAELVHPEDRARISRSLNHFLRQSAEDRWIAQYRFRKGDGTYAHVEEKGYAVRNGRGKSVRMIGVLSDITQRVQEEQRLRLMDSVITNTHDAVMILEPSDTVESGLQIAFVNRAFTRMTGYEPEELLGQSPLIQKGVYTDKEEIKLIKQAVKKNRPHEATLLFYRKKGDEFWTNLTLTPVENDRGVVSHWIGMQRDVTAQVVRNNQKRLIADVSRLFNQDKALAPCLQEVLSHVSTYAGFDAAEVWLPDMEYTRLHLAASFGSGQVGQTFYAGSRDITAFLPGEGLPGKIWQTGESDIWRGIQMKAGGFARWQAAKRAGLQVALGIPFTHNNRVEGVLILLTGGTESRMERFRGLLEPLENFMGAEIKRKRLETELNQIFASAPEIISMLSPEGRFLRANPAACSILEKEESELLGQSIFGLVHPEDREFMRSEFNRKVDSGSVNHFETRVISGSGRTVWLNWSTSSNPEHGVVYAVAQDVTAVKELSELLDKSSKLARVGAWEVNLENESVHWSNITRQIHEVDDDFSPTMENIRNFYREEDSLTLSKAFESVIMGEGSIDYELPLITAKGNERWTRVIGEPEFKDGKCVRIYGSFQDIHERKSAEVRLQRTADNIPGAIFQYRLYPDGRDEITNLTRGAFKLWGLSPEACMEDVNRIWNQTRAGGDMDLVAQSVSRSAETLEPWHCEYRSRLPDGRILWHEGFGAPTRLPDGSTLWDSLVIDITEKKETERLLERASAMAKIGSWELDLVNRGPESMYWSPMSLRILGAPQGTLLSKEESLDYFLGESRTELLEASERLIRTGEEFDLELIIAGQDGEPHWVRCIGQSERSGNRCTRIFGSFQDIHDRKEYENSLKRLNDALAVRARELAVSNAELEQFAYVASHDLQEPLRMVTSFLSRLESKYGDQLDDKAHQYIHFAVDGAKRMLRIILDLLEFSRVGKAPDQLEPISLRETLEEVTKVLQRKIDQSGARIEYEHLPVIHTYRTPLTQILQNLMDNAIKYARKDVPPVIRLEAEEAKGEWIIRVIDNGIGIDPEYFEKIFVIFQRLHLKEEYGGTGMGLAIVKKNVETLGGRISVESEPGLGSTFIFTIPTAT